MVMVNEISSLVRSRGKLLNGPRTKDLVDAVWPEIQIGVRMFSENQTTDGVSRLRDSFGSTKLGGPPDVDKLPHPTNIEMKLSSCCGWGQL